MTDGIASHTAKIEIWPMLLRKACKTRIGHLTTADLATVDEFHIRGRKATPKLAARDVTDLTLQGSIDLCKKFCTSALNASGFSRYMKWLPPSAAPITDNLACGIWDAIQGIAFAPSGLAAPVIQSVGRRMRDNTFR